MKHSEKIDQLALAFVLAQGNMGDIIKTSTNPHYKSKYAALPDVVEAIVPALQSQGIAILQGGSTTVETMLIHAASGQWLSMEFELPTSPDAQKACAANTYARRYALLEMVCAAAEDDDGNRASARFKPKQTTQQDGPAKPTLVERALKLGLIPQADRAMFLEMCRSKIRGCEDLQKMTSGHAEIIGRYFTKLEGEK